MRQLINSSIGGFGLVISGTNEETQKATTAIVAAVKSLIKATGAHPDYRLATTIISDRDLSIDRFRRIQRNARLLSNWLRSCLNQFDITHLANAHVCSPIFFIKVKIGSLDPGRDYSGLVGGSSIAAREHWIKAEGSSAGEAYIRYLMSWIAEYSMALENPDRFLIRFGTSFGFDQTTVMGIPYKENDILIRVAAGTEDFETLWCVRCAIASLNQRAKSDSSLQ